MPVVWPEKTAPSSSSQWDAPQPEAKRPRRSDSISAGSDSSGDSTMSLQNTRTIFDIAKAGCLLARPPMNTYFEDEEEMRRIYSLIYDVFRYKSVLNQALIDTTFFLQYPQYQNSVNHVWLLFYDLYKRRFLPRDIHDEDKRQVLFDAVGLTPIDNKLWKLRVRLAASLARLRIKNNALHLTQLLPWHLRDDKVIALHESFVTGWINTFKLKKDELLKAIEKHGLNPIQKKQYHLGKNNYQFDHLCPKFILCHPFQRADMAQSLLVQEYQIVLQDRAFCLGPAIMCRVLADMELTGHVAQTHINSLRTTAYLANILADNDKMERLLAFGAGDRKAEYEEYLHLLGVTNTQVIAERFVDTPPDSALLCNISAVLATPPNTYSGVVDPVDLVCSRGGDLNMLEVLTENELGSGSRDRMNTIMEEQQQTLRLAMSKPQIQVVLYETHSIVRGENEGMVMRLVNEMNQNARDRHAEEQGRTVQSANVDLQVKSEEGGEKIETFTDIEIPPCDLFEIATMPDLCPNGDSCLQLEEEGCYLALLQRKEIVRLDAKYMIKIAESRGLFGSEVKKSTSGRTHKRKEVLSTRSGSGGSVTKQQGRRTKIEMDRIAAPTQASLLRSVSTSMSGDMSEEGTASVMICERHQKHTTQECNKMAEARRKDARRWWEETTKHIASMDEYTRLKISSPDEDTIIPTLTLRRTQPLIGGCRVIFPLHISSIEFRQPTNNCITHAPQCSLV